MSDYKMSPAEISERAAHMTPIEIEALLIHVQELEEMLKDYKVWNCVIILSPSLIQFLTHSLSIYILFYSISQTLRAVNQTITSAYEHVIGLTAPNTTGGPSTQATPPVIAPGHARNNTATVPNLVAPSSSPPTAFTSSSISLAPSGDVSSNHQRTATQRHGLHHFPTSPLDYLHSTAGDRNGRPRSALSNRPGSANPLRHSISGSNRGYL